ncbi:hypothetical protein J6590_030127 [Homalodisca vitripennis]|nr:hypothetical protein J6590_030127 [Homalodisca vitripennis]
MTEQPRFQGNHRATAVTTANMPTPPAARGESVITRQRPASIQDVSYADAVRRSPSPSILQIKGCSANLKENSQRTKSTDQNRQNQTNKKLHVQGSLSLLHQKARYATNKLDEIQLMCEGWKSDILVVTENGLLTSLMVFFRMLLVDGALFHHCHRGIPAAESTLELELVSLNTEIPFGKLEPFKGQLVCTGLVGQMFVITSVSKFAML